MLSLQISVFSLISNRCFGNICCHGRGFGLRSRVSCSLINRRKIGSLHGDECSPQGFPFSGGHLNDLILARKGSRGSMVVVRADQGFDFNGGGGGGGGWDKSTTSRVLGNLALAIGLTYLTITVQLGWISDAIVSIWLENCGEIVGKQIVAQGVLSKMVKIVKERPEKNVREKILVLVDAWKDTFGGQEIEYRTPYQELRDAGVEFPPRTENIASLQPVTRIVGDSSGKRVHSGALGSESRGTAVSPSLTREPSLPPPSQPSREKSGGTKRALTREPSLPSPSQPSTEKSRGTKRALTREPSLPPPSQPSREKSRGTKRALTREPSLPPPSQLPTEKSRGTKSALTREPSLPPPSQPSLQLDRIVQ